MSPAWYHIAAAVAASSSVAVDNIVAALVAVLVAARHQIFAFAFVDVDAAAVDVELDADDWVVAFLRLMEPYCHFALLPLLARSVAQPQQAQLFAPPEVVQRVAVVSALLMYFVSHEPEASQEL